MLKWLPLRDALRFYFNNARGKEEAVNTVVAGVSLWLRTYSSDLNVAVEALVIGEYDVIRCDRPEVIIDAGANIGTSAIAFARRYPNAKIYSIEMEKANYDLLVKNTKSFSNIIPIHAAIAASNGRRIIRNRATGSWGFTIIQEEGSVKPSLDSECSIETITLDQLVLVHNMPKIDILKMDIEGAEKEVLEAGGDWVGKTDILMVELHDRICMGCDRAFYLATADFQHFEKFGEKVCAYRVKSC